MDAEDALFFNLGHARKVGDEHLSVKRDILIYIFGNTDMRYTLRQLDVFLAVGAVPPCVSRGRIVAGGGTWPNRSAYHPHSDLHAAQLRRCWTQLCCDAADNGGLCRPPRVYYKQSRARWSRSAGGIPR